MDPAQLLRKLIDVLYKSAQQYSSRLILCVFSQYKASKKRLRLKNIVIEEYIENSEKHSSYRKELVEKNKRKQQKTESSG